MNRTSVFCRISVLVAMMLVGLTGCLSEAPESVDQTVPAPSFLLDENGRPVLAVGETNDGNLSSTTGKITSSPLTTTDLNSITATDVVNALLGAGVNAPTVSNITFSGAAVATGTFSGGTGVIGFESGIMLSSGNIASVPGPNVSDGITTNNGTPGDADLDGLIPGFNTLDAAVLEFDFECPVLQVISFTYVFTSDEYNEFVNSSFNDVFGFFVNGVNIALLPDLVTPVSINNVNCDNPYNPPAGGLNCASFINNDVSDGGGAIDTEMDGLTIVFTATATVNPGLNHIKLALADAGDRNLDSNVFIEGSSFLCVPPPPPASLDIKPGSCPNPMNVKAQGVVPMAIVGTTDFDVNDIDASTVKIDGVSPIRTKVQDVATPFDGDLCDCHELTGDGIDDLALKFKVQDLVHLLTDPVVTITLTGQLLDGTTFEISDCVKVVGTQADKKVQ